MKNITIILLTTLLNITSFFGITSTINSQLHAQAFVNYVFSTWAEFDNWLISQGKTTENIQSQRVMSDGTTVVTMDDGTIIEIE